MRLVDKKLLAAVRRERCCWCWKPPPSQAAHVLSKGAGQVDAAYNVLPLCNACHRHHHDGHMPNREQLLKIAAELTGMTVDEVERETYRIRRATAVPGTARPKGSRGVRSRKATPRPKRSRPSVAVDEAARRETNDSGL